MEPRWVLVHGKQMQRRGSWALPAWIKAPDPTPLPSQNLTPCSTKQLFLVWENQVQWAPCLSPHDKDNCLRWGKAGNKERRGTHGKISVSSLPTHLLQEEQFDFPTCLADEMKQLEPMSLMLCLYNRWQIRLKSLALFCLLRWSSCCSAAIRGSAAPGVFKHWIASVRGLSWSWFPLPPTTLARTRWFVSLSQP